MEKERKCECCGSAFLPKQDHQKFCSNNCRLENHYKKKFGVKEPLKTVFNDNQTENTTDDRTRLKTPVNADMGIFERLMEERENRITDKIKLAQAEMEIKMLQKELEEAKSMQAMVKEFAPALITMFNPVKPTGT